MKKPYTKPTTEVVKLQSTMNLLQMSGTDPTPDMFNLPGGDWQF